MWLDLESRKCRHYEHRPNICRDTIERNDADCRAYREKYTHTIERNSQVDKQGDEHSRIAWHVRSQDGNAYLDL